MTKEERDFRNELEDLLRKYKVKIELYEPTNDYGSMGFFAERVFNNDGFDFDFTYLSNDVLEEK